MCSVAYFTEPRDPLAEARKKLLELKDTLPASALTTPVRKRSKEERSKKQKREERSKKQEKKRKKKKNEARRR